MYWPSGVPRVYAYDGPDHEIDIEKEVVGSNGEPEKNGEDASKCHSVYDSSDDQSRSITDLRIARLEHIFVTISDACLTVWSSRVR